MKSGHGDIRSLFRAGAARVGAKSEPMTRPGAPFVVEPGGVQIARIRDGKARTKEEALKIARKQRPGVEQVGSDARWYVFREVGR